MNNKAFNYKRIAVGYKDRPFLHKHVMEQLQRDMSSANFHNGLDVGCGAGLSTKALKLICDKVTGTDISEEMILAAKELCPENDYTFFVSKAEETPVPAVQYDIVTVAGALPWIEEGAFLENLNAIINKEGIVLIYDFWISDRMLGIPKYTDWYHNKYLKRFPRLARKEKIWTDELVCQYGFQIQKQTTYELEYIFNIEAFVQFMMLQSNVSAKIEGKGQHEEEIKAWFEDSLRNIFDSQERVLLFDGYSWLISRKNCYFDK